MGDAETVLICGGDGTIHQMANIIKKSGCDKAISVIPIGTGNDFSRNFTNRAKEPTEHLKNIIADPKVVPLDVFSINRRAYFSNYAGIGLDAAILSTHQRMLSNLSAFSKIPFFNTLLYVPAGVWTIATFVGSVAGADGLQYKNIIVGNLRTFAGGGLFCADSSPGDGVAEVVKIRRNFELFKFGLSRFFPSLTFKNEALARPAGVKIASSPGDAPVELDGEDYCKFFEGTRDFHLFHEGTLRVCV